MSDFDEILTFSQMGDREVEDILKKHKIGLTVQEARKITELIGRDPTLTEAVIWGIQGSEHCSYKSSRRFLKLLPHDAPHVMLGPSQDAGIIEIANIEGKKYGIVMAHESHNHPSQIVPYEGAATGIGGIVRDVVCMGAKVIAAADPLRFGDIKKIPHKVIAKEVCRGIAGYGNPIGVPVIAGDVYFDSSFNDNCLVNVVALGLVCEDEIIHSRAPKEAGEKEYDIIVVGKPADNSGMGGASFASLAMDTSKKEENKGAVQEPNAFLQRHLLQSTYELFEKLKKQNALDKVGFKDLGAGGNVCATVEMVEASGYGADIMLDKIPVAMANLHPSVIACSETQERLCWICAPELTKGILEHYNTIWALPEIASGACAKVIGKVTRSTDYVLTYGGKTVCKAKASDITKGLEYKRALKPLKKKLFEPQFPEPDNLAQVLEDLLSSENIASREPIYEQYDKNVQGITILEPGRADAGIIAPFRNRNDVPEQYHKIGVALSVDSNARQGLIDPYFASVNAVAEGMRNVVCVGATPLCISDCLNYGNPEKPERMWEFVEGVKGIVDVLHKIPWLSDEKYPLPCISGNVSFYNESPHQAISPSAIIATLGKIDDWTKHVTMSFQHGTSALLLFGERKDELGASEYYRLFNHLGKNIPKTDFVETKRQLQCVLELIERGLVLACHDISEGGLAVTLAEMSFSKEIGFEIDITDVASEDLRTDKKLFSETGGFVLEIPINKLTDTLSICENHRIKPIKLGRTKTNLGDRILIRDNKKVVLSTALSHLKTAWTNGLRNKL